MAMSTTVRGNPLSMARFICSYFMLGVCGTGNDDNPEEVTTVASGTMGDVTHDWLRSVLPTEFHHAIPRVYTTLTETYWHTTLSSFRCLVDQPVNPNSLWGLLPQQ